MSKVVIIGNGIAGITVARHVRKRSNDDILVISAESNHFFSRTALMYIYMGHMTFEHTKPYEDHFWAKNRIQLKNAFIQSINTDSKNLITSTGEEISYDKLVIASGSKPNKFGWIGQDLNGVQGLYSLQDLEAMELATQNIKKAVIIGGGLIGIEMAEMLRSRKIDVSFLVREAHFWGNVLPTEESEIIRKHCEDHGVKFLFNTELKEIVDNGNGHAKGVITGDGQIIDCQFVGLTAGVSPNVEFVKSSNIEVGRGVLVNDFLETNINDVYACGDCAEIVTPNSEHNRIEPLWYTGRMQGEALAKTLTGKKIRYERGIWFNSAKFFDIEYQTYGFVPSKITEKQHSFYWQSSDQLRCIRVVFNSQTQVVEGVNIFGFRMRHKVWELWLAKERKIDFVMAHLADANFDPEFYKQYESQFHASFRTQFPNISFLPKRRHWITKRLLQEF
jgi:NAD(P)H-nitrite reductase large subunit